jgi:phosphoglycolate phosphatase
MIKAVIFDLDGTLLDSINDIATCSNLVLQHAGHPTHPVARYKVLVGDGLHNLARKVLPPGHNHDVDIAAFIDVYRGLYQTKWNETSNIYDGIVDLLNTLMQRDIALGVLSNKRHDFTQLCVSTFFPVISFKAVCGERAGIPIKPHPQAALSMATQLGIPPQEIAFVGDSEIDIETGRRASMVSVGVTWGFRPRELLVESGADVIIDHPRELCAALGLQA